MGVPVKRAQKQYWYKQPCSAAVTGCCEGLTAVHAAASDIWATGMVNPPKEKEAGEDMAMALKILASWPWSVSMRFVVQSFRF